MSEEEYRRLVGRLVRMQRQWLKFSREELAKAAGLSPSVEAAIERGDRSVDAWRVGLLADALDTTPEWLLDRSPMRVQFPGPARKPSTGEQRVTAEQVTTPSDALG